MSTNAPQQLRHIGFGVDAVQLCRPEQTVDRRRAFATCIGTDVRSNVENRRRSSKPRSKASGKINRIRATMRTGR